MHLRGIGHLTNQGQYWRLVYDQCGHSLDLARGGLEDPRQAETYIRGGLAHCLSCRAAAARAADGRRLSFLQLLARAADPAARFGSPQPGSPAEVRAPPPER